MTATTSTPSIPPRPARGADKDAPASGPKIPPRPNRTRPERSMSPSADRFAPSPLNEGLLAKARPPPSMLSPHRSSFGDRARDPIERSSSVDLPSVGEEGAEYGALASEAEEERGSRNASPEQTRTISAGLELHAPKPSLPANRAKAQVQAVTRTDSDRAASFGIGRPGSRDETRATSRDSHRKRPSTSLSQSSDHDYHDDEHGIPEIGQRVPMNPHLGDVQAPSPGPGEGQPRHHSRRHSARALPPGSYGLHGHGVAPQDKLEKEYYKKHPDIQAREEHTPIHDRQNDYAMSREDLNKLVRDTASRGRGFGTAKEFRGTPTDEVAFQASEEYVRHTSPRPKSAAPQTGHHRRTSSLAHSVTAFNEEDAGADEDAIHVDDPKHPEYRSYGDEEPEAEDEDYTAPILASDEVQKNKNAYRQRPAVHPPADRRGSNYEAEEAPSRPISRPISLHKESSQPEIRYTPLEDVEEYEPLFPEEVKKEKQLKEQADENKHHHHFPSKDIWEDAPSSIHYTATVSTPDLPESEHHRARSAGQAERPLTPAHAFAKQQEELAEREAKRRSVSKFLPLSEERKPNWAAHQAHLKVERAATGSPRFPSRDVWEDTPESHLQSTTVSTPQQEEEEEEEEEQEPETRPVRRSPERPAVPSRPKPAVSDKPKPQIPARPAKSSAGETREKPPVPTRPAGGKIAALQAGFMNDLNQRLKIGPQVHKRDESPEKEAEADKEKAPLSDARKSRARGPQRRAPAKEAAPAAQTSSSVSTLDVSAPVATWSLDGEGILTVIGEAEGESTEPAEETEAPAEDAPTVKANDPEPDTSKVQDEVAETLEQPKPTEQEPKPEPESSAGEVAHEDAPEQEPKLEQKTLVANMAGESVLEADVAKTADGNDVEPVAVRDEVKP
ncbi:altered inheritance of mitochondria protein 21 [Emericellopsis atlantica]|uniref:Altered inheritance of mitochondria protein 21 n=1 Tax=Emericellopsis atlantica TaxID=2614577 RepID=A0A9P7ZU03_9HYPO|nr:altered inheritance of mitochondria protein 21 [Emericellopsis atlantica]KAG9257782.1 altered inheritance of mitochondria protein 21 [Emericellopsis atlantica]